MTVADNTSRNQYTATSGQTVFAYTFEIVDKDDIVVLKNGTKLSEGSNYTVSNVGNDSGGNVTLGAGATAGDILTLYRDMPYSRTQNYTNSGDFLASEVNSDFDNLWLAGEQTNRSFSQSIRKPIIDSTSISMELPAAADRAGKLLSFTGDGSVSVATSATNGTVANLVTYSPAGTGAVDTTVEAKLRESVSVNDFGATGNGTTDDASAIQLALDSGASAVLVPQGTYRCDSTLTIPKNVSVFGEGPQSIFDFSNATTLTDNECIRTAQGSYTALPALNTAIQRGDTTITFASAPSVSPGDVIVIYNDTNGSWADWRTYYRAGEQVRVMQVSGNTVTVDGVLHDDYAISDVDLYKATDFTQCRIANFKVIANKSIASNFVDGVTLRTAIDSVIENVIVDQASYTGIYIDRCFNASVLNCLAKDEGDIDEAGDYGLTIGNSHIVQVIGGEFVSARHGVTIGGASGIGFVPNRFININSAYIATIGLNIQAGDIHGNSEYVSYDNCDIVGGISPGGDHTTIQNCRITYGVDNGDTPVLYSELKGFTHRFANNLVINKAVDDGSRGHFIDVGGNADVVSDMTRGGTFTVTGNDFRAENDSVTISQGIAFYDLVTAGTTEPRDISITNNTIHKADWVNSTRLRLKFSCLIRRSATATSRFRRISIDGNVGNGGPLLLNDNSSTGSFADIVLLTNNHFMEGDQPEISLADRVIVNNNTFENQKFYGLRVIGNSTNKIPYAFIENNRFINCGWAHTSSSTTNANLIVWRCENAIVQNNHGFSNFQALQVITADNADGFTVGETITGGTSGRTAIVFETRDPFIFIRDTASGSFTAGETITGGTSGHTAQLEASPNQQKFKYFYHLSMYQNDNLWHDHNVSQHSLSNYSNSNTTVVTTI